MTSSGEWEPPRVAEEIKQQIREPVPGKDAIPGGGRGARAAKKGTRMSHKSKGG